MRQSRIEDRINAGMLARVEVLAALAAMHRRFCSELPRLKPGAADRDVTWRQRLIGQSIQLSGASELADAGRAVAAYRDWLGSVITRYDVKGGDEFEAARICAPPVRELHSICRIADAFPESARRRAQKIAERFGR